MSFFLPDFCEGSISSGILCPFGKCMSLRALLSFFHEMPLGKQTPSIIQSNSCSSWGGFEIGARATGAVGIGVGAAGAAGNGAGGG